MARRADGEGTIVQRGDGRWVAAIALGGKRRWLYGKTRRDVVEKLSGLQQDAQAGRLVKASRQSVDAYLTTWLDVVKPQLRPSTWASYEELLRLHVRPTLGGVRLQALRPLHLVHLYAARIADGVGARRVQMAQRVLHKALGDAVKWRALHANPAADVTPPRPQREEQRVWTAEE